MVRCSHFVSLFLLLALSSLHLMGVSGSNRITIRERAWEIQIEATSGEADIYFRGRLLLQGVTAGYRPAGGAEKVARGVPFLLIRRSSVSDELGRGSRHVLLSLMPGGDTLERRFTFYRNSLGMVVQTIVRGTPQQQVASVTPLLAASGFGAGRPGSGRFLFVPFDNDKWIRYGSRPWGSRETGFEAGAWFDADSKAGLVVGSIDHNLWKTALISESSDTQIKQLTVCCGFTAPETRDTLPHGTVGGGEVASARIFVGWFSDWRNGMEAFGMANAQVQRPLEWSGGAPFGWNSWGAVQSKINFTRAVEVSDSFKELQTAGFHSKGPVYVGLDSYWDNFSDEELARFVLHCKANGQEAGIYWAPFVDWAKRPARSMEGSNRFTYSDAYLYAHGKPQDLDGAWALDPTHPGVQARMRYFFDRFKKAGFTYIKLDFLTHGALEADRHFDPKVTTGMQAYWIGMQYAREYLGPDIYITLAISPLFPGGFAHSRRIACDAFALMKDTEYTLNGLSGGWWLNRIYPFNDPDHIVLDKASEGENRARVTTAALTGMLINGDDLSSFGSTSAKEKAMQFLTHAPILQVVKLGQSFRPVAPPEGDSAPAIYMHREAKQLYVALFNFDEAPRTIGCDVGELGLSGRKGYRVTELWTGETRRIESRLETTMGAKDARLFRIEL